MKVSLHSGRNGRARHNDHHFVSDHIDPKKTGRNVFYFGDKNAKNCVEADHLIYKKLFSKTVEKQNEKYRKKGNYSRIKTTDDWAESSRYSPREDILAIGDKNKMASRKDLLDCLWEMELWEREQFGSNYVCTSIAVHCDEKGANHGHKRKVFYYHDADGDLVPGVKGALKELGIPLPDPTKPESKYNNRLMTYTAMCREKWQEIVISHGYEIDTTPDPTKRPHQSIADYQKDQILKEAQKRADELIRQANDEKDKIIDEANKTAKKVRIEAQERYDDVLDTAYSWAEQVKAEAKKDVDANRQEARRCLEFMQSNEKQLNDIWSEVDKIKSDDELLGDVLDGCYHVYTAKDGTKKKMTGRQYMNYLQAKREKTVQVLKERQEKLMESAKAAVKDKSDQFSL